MRAAELTYSATPGPMTTLDGVSDELGDLPTDPVPLGALVQGLILHEFWADAYAEKTVPVPS